MPRALTLFVLVLLASPAPGAGEPYRVGPGDVLEVLVRDRSDLSRLPTVQTTGSVFLPRAGHVEVAGLSTAEIAERIATLLAAEDLPDPGVTVRVREYKSQFVWVHGQVLNPGRKALRGGTRLIEQAGGRTPFGADRVTVGRIDAATGGTSDIEADLKAIRAGKAEDVVLTPGDRVAVQARGL